MEEFSCCSVCCRTPLVGESVTVLARGRREAPVCDLCRRKPRAAQLGERVRRDRVRSAAGAETVRRIFPTPVPAERPAARPAAAA
jgi:hypothetical protein